MPVSSTGILVGVTVVSVGLCSLAILQPKLAVLIAEAVQAESGVAPDQAAPVRLAAEPRRRPIEPGEWVRLLTKQAAN